MSRGSRYSGMPTAIIPPGTGSASNTVTAQPSCARRSAAVSPAGPAPITATFPALAARGRVGCQGAVSASAMKRLIVRMATGWSMSPRRQRCSQKAGQTRPQMRAKGLRSRWTASASAKRPSAARLT